MSIASSGAAYRLALASRGAGGGDAGPYASSLDARRAAVLNALLFPTRRGGQILSEWDSVDAGADVFVAITDVPNARDQYYQLRCDTIVSEGDTLGVPYAYDAEQDEAYGTIRTGPALPIPDGQRASGFRRGDSATSSSTTPGVSVALWDATDDWTWAIRSFTRVSGAFAVYQVDTDPNTADDGTNSGVIWRANNGQARFEVRADGGATYVAASVGALSPGQEFIAVGGYERITTGTVEQWCRVYDTSGTLLASNTRTHSILAADLDNTDPNVIHDGVWIASFPGVSLTAAQADDVADGTDPTGGGTRDRYMVGVYTGIFDPTALTRLIVATGTGAEPIATWSRS